MRMNKHEPDPIDDQLSNRLEAIHDQLIAGGRVGSQEMLLMEDIGPACDLLAMIERVRRFESESSADRFPAAAGDTRLNQDTQVDDCLPATIGRFQLQRRVGQGGHGIVLLAFDPRLKRQVALKLPRPESLLTRELRSRFVREAAAAAALSHPNVVQVFEAGSDGPWHYIASAYCPGPTLSDWVRTQPELPSCRSAARLVSALADAVDHAHERGILHRDLKPANVLLDFPPDALSRDSVDLAEVARITDFGLAKIEGQEENHTRTGAILGTPAYMSPEQAAGGRVPLGPATDIYSLGAILYELLTGCPPFRGQSLLEILESVRNCDPPAPRRMRAEIPRDLEAICLKCLEKSPVRRYGTAAELSADLQRFCDGRTVQARPLPYLQRIARWLPRHAVLSLSGLILGLLVAFAVHGVATSARLRKGKQSLLVQADRARRAEQEQERLDQLALQRHLETRLAVAGRELAGIAMGSADRARRHLDVAHEMIQGLPENEKTQSDLRRLAIEVATRCRIVEGEIWDSPAPLSQWILSPSGDRYAILRATQRELSIEALKEKHSVQLVLSGTRAERVLAFDRRGRRLAVDNLDDSGKPRIAIWDVRKGKRIASFPSYGQANRATADFSADGDLFAIPMDKDVRIFRVSSGKLERVLPVGPSIQAVRFSPDLRNTKLAVFANLSASVYRVADGAEILTTPTMGQSVSVAWSPDSRLLAIGGVDTMSVEVWSVLEKTKFASLRDADTSVRRVGFSPDGNHLFVADGENKTVLWDLNAAVPRARLVGSAIGFVGNDRLAFHDSARDRLGFWSIEAAPALRTLLVGLSPQDHASTVGGGRLLVATSTAGRKATFFDLETGRLLAQLAAEDAMFDPSGRYLITTSRLGTFCWPVQRSANQEKTVFRIGPARPLLIAGERQSLKLLRGQRCFLVTPVRDHVQRIVELDPERLQVKEIARIGGARKVLGISPGSRFLVTRHRQSIVVHDLAATARIVWQQPAAASTTWSFPAGEASFAIKRQDQIQIWDTEHWTRPVLQRTDQRAVQELCWIPGDRLLAATVNKTMVQLFETNRLDPWAELPVPTGNSVAHLSVSRNGRYLIGLGSHGRAHVWDLEVLRRELAQLGLDLGHLRPIKPSDHRPVEVTIAVPLKRVRAANSGRELTIAPFDKSAVDAAWTRGRDYVRDEKWVRAIMSCTHAIQLNPNSHHGFFWRGRAHLAVGKYAEAAEDFGRSVTLHPDDAWACHFRAWLLVAGPEPLRDPETALVLAKRAVAMNPEEAAFVRTLILTHFRLTDYRRAGELLRQLKDQPHQTTSLGFWLLSTMVHQELGETELAAQSLATATRRIQDWPRVDALYRALHEEARELVADPTP